MRSISQAKAIEYGMTATSYPLRVDIREKIIVAAALPEDFSLSACTMELSHDH